MDDVTEVYEELARLPSLSEARICNGQTPGHVSVLSQWTQRDLQRKENIKFSRTHIVQLNVTFATPPQETNNE